MGQGAAVDTCGGAGVTILVEFEVLGLPAPQGDKSAVMIAGKPRVIEGRRGVGRERHATWRTVVADAAREVAVAGEAPFDGPLGLSVEFRFPMPKSRSKAARTAGRCAKTTPPDLDKLLRALGDSLKAGGLIADDARFSAIEACKVEVIGWTGAVITINRELP